jgi:hypothetical protein
VLRPLKAVIPEVINILIILSLRGRKENVKVLESYIGFVI